MKCDAVLQHDMSRNSPAEKHNRIADYIYSKDRVENKQHKKQTFKH